MGEKIFKLEGLSLDDDEARRYAKALQEVQKECNVYVDPKKLAIANLIGVAGSIYIPRFIAWSNDAKSKGPVNVQTINEPAPQKQSKQEQMMTPSQVWPQGG